MFLFQFRITEIIKMVNITIKTLEEWGEEPEKGITIFLKGVIPLNFTPDLSGLITF